jgi:hypothetical protein
MQPPAMGYAMPPSLSTTKVGGPLPAMSGQSNDVQELSNRDAVRDRSVVCRAASHINSIQIASIVYKKQKGNFWAAIGLECDLEELS